MRKICSIDYCAYVSRLRSLNPRYKAVVAVGTLLFCVAADSIPVSAIVFLTMGMVTTLAGGLAIKKYAAFLWIPLAFLILGTAAIVLGISTESHGRILFSAGGVSVYLPYGGVGMAFSLILKAMGALSAMYMLVLSTPASEVIGVLRSLRVPKLILELMNMIYRFIFVMTDTQHCMRQAAESRLGYCDFKTSCRTFGSSAGNLFVVSLKKANTYYDALTARCYDGELLFLEEEKKVKVWQVGAAACYFLILILVWRFTS